MATTSARSAALNRLIRTWAEAWGLPGLEDAISVSFSPRLRRSLGRCTPTTGQVVITSSLAHGPFRSLADVACHEAAHVAAFVLSGSVSDPHGPLWHELVRTAGFRPRVRRTITALGDRKARRQIAPRLLYEHRCPVCQSVRFARKHVSRWRCAECALAGLSGELVVTKHEGGR
jgi:ribosomal protein L37AE/L43A